LRGLTRSNSPFESCGALVGLLFWPLDCRLLLALDSSGNS